MPRLVENFRAGVRSFLQLYVYLRSARSDRASVRQRLKGALHQGKDQLVRNLLWSFIVNENGATAIEYGLLAAGISVAIIAVVFSLGTSLNSTFSSVSSQLQ